MEGLKGGPGPAGETEPGKDSGSVSQGWGALKGENLMRGRTGGFLRSGTGAGLAGQAGSGQREETLGPGVTRNSQVGFLLGRMGWRALCEAEPSIARGLSCSLRVMASGPGRSLAGKHGGDRNFTGLCP